MRISDWSSDVCSSDLEVLKIGSTTAIGVEESRQGLRLLMHGGVVSMGFAVLTQLKLAAAEAASWFRIGAGASGIAGGFSFALLGVGPQVGLSVGRAQLLGLLTARGVLVPLMTVPKVPLGVNDLLRVVSGKSGLFSVRPG